MEAAEPVFGSFQDPSGCEEVGRIMHTIGDCLQDTVMERAYSVTAVPCVRLRTIVIQR